MLFWKLIVSLLAAMALYWGMVTAFRLLNLPSTASVLEGIGLLLLLVAAGWVLYRNLWFRNLWRR